MSLLLPFNLYFLVWLIVVILIVIWLVGLIRRGGKGFIHLLLIVAALLVLYNLFINR